VNAIDVFNRIALSNANACDVTFIILCAALRVFREKEARTSEFGFALNNRYCIRLVNCFLLRPDLITMVYLYTVRVMVMRAA